MSKGTYAAVTFDLDTTESLRKYISDAGIPNAVDDFHCTLLYSRRVLPDYSGYGKYHMPMHGTALRLNVFTTRSAEGDQSRCLVVEFSSCNLVERHTSLMEEHGATYDYPCYRPHITLSYDIGDLDISELPDIEEYLDSVAIVHEYHEELTD